METLPDGAIYGGQSRGRGEVIGRNYVMLLKDRVYRNSFKDAINEILKEHIQDKVVIDVGCGTGYFSILCAMAGAKRVYAVEPSTMALEAKKAVVDNGLSDKVTVIYSRVENIKIEEKVDVIVSDWTDHYIIYKSMLDSFFKVRDQFLKCDGLIFPSMAKLYMAPDTTTVKYKKQQRFWRNVCGINMSSIFQLVRKRAFEKPSVENIDTRTLLASPQVVMQLDCYRTEVSDLKSFKSAFCFNSLIPATEEDVGHIDLNRPPQIHVATLHGFGFWFETSFSCPVTIDGTTRVHDTSTEKHVFSTSPDKPSTPWKQTVIYMLEPLIVKENEELRGSVEIKPIQDNYDNIHISIRFRLAGQEFVRETVMT